MCSCVNVDVRHSCCQLVSMFRVQVQVSLLLLVVKHVFNSKCCTVSLLTKIMFSYINVFRIYCSFYGVDLAICGPNL